MFDPLRFRYAAFGVANQFELRLLGQYLSELQLIIERTQSDLRGDFERRFAERERFFKQLKDDPEAVLPDEEREARSAPGYWERRDPEQTVRRDLERLTIASYLMSLWAVWESAVIECLEALQRRNKLSVRFADLRKGETLTRFELYLNQHLGLALTSDQEQRQTLEQFMVVRHAYAHAHGIEHRISERHRIRIRNWSSRGSEDLSLHSGRLIVAPAFARRAHSAATDTLLPLLAVVRSARLVVPEQPGTSVAK